MSATKNDIQLLRINYLRGPNDNKVTGWRKLAEIADRVLEDMAPEPPGSKDGMSLEDRHAAAKQLRKEAEKKLR